MLQQGEVFELETRGPDGQGLWAYRYRTGGRGYEAGAAGRVQMRAGCVGGA